MGLLLCKASFQESSSAPIFSAICLVLNPTGSWIGKYPLESKSSSCMEVLSDQLMVSKSPVLQAESFQEVSSLPSVQDVTNRIDDVGFFRVVFTDVCSHVEIDNSVSVCHEILPKATSSKAKSIDCPAGIEHALAPHVELHPSV
ncbi:hypothetical protein D3C77_481730 [compost metagenome]